MKIRIGITIFIIGFTLITGLSLAQDFHLSHYEANPLNLNPALTGLRLDEDWAYRINANYREQGGKYLGGSNVTVAAGFDMPINKKFSFGQFVMDNKSVNGSFNTFNCMLSGSYKITHKGIEGYSRHNLSVGLQLGVLQKSVKPQNFVYDSQYSSLAPDGFDENLPSGEIFQRENFLRFDANIGIYYRFINKNKKYSPFGGFSIYHLTQPNESFIGEISKTPMRYMLHGGCHFTISKEFSVLPQILYMNQASANELNTEILGFYKIQGTDYAPMLGFAWRNKDALILHLGLKQKNNIYRISYDINTSYQKIYTHGRGGLELSIIYTWSKKPKDSAIEGEIPKF